MTANAGTVVGRHTHTHVHTDGTTHGHAHSHRGKVAPAATHNKQTHHHAAEHAKQKAKSPVVTAHGHGPTVKALKPTRIHVRVVR